MRLPFLDVVLKLLPIVAALATALVSLWRELSKNDVSSSQPFWKKLHASGWTLIALGMATCVIGIWAGVRNLRGAVDDAREKERLLAELQGTRTDLTKQLLESRKQAIEATTELASAEARHATELSKRQDLTFTSLLSSVVEPSRGIVELQLREPLPGGPSVRLAQPTIAQFQAEQNYEYWSYSLMFAPVYKSINWMHPWPISFEARLGDWPDHKSANGMVPWIGSVAIKDRKAENLEQSASIEGAGHQVVLRMPALESQSMLGLWRGPENKKHLQLHIWIRLYDSDEATQRRIKAAASQVITKSVVYYTISARKGLCKRGEFNSPHVEVRRNSLNFEYLGVTKLENTECPAYVIGPKT